MQSSDNVCSLLQYFSIVKPLLSLSLRDKTYTFLVYFNEKIEKKVGTIEPGIQMRIQK